MAAFATYCIRPVPHGGVEILSFGASLQTYEKISVSFFPMLCPAPTLFHLIIHLVKFSHINMGDRGLDVERVEAPHSTSRFRVEF